MVSLFYNFVSGPPQWLNLDEVIQNVCFLLCPGFEPEKEDVFIVMKPLIKYDHTLFKMNWVNLIKDNTGKGLVELSKPPGPRSLDDPLEPETSPRFIELFLGILSKFLETLIKIFLKLPLILQTDRQIDFAEE